MVVDGIVFDITFSVVKGGDLVRLGEDHYCIAKSTDEGMGIVFLEDGETDNLFHYADDVRIVEGDERDEVEKKYGVFRLVLLKPSFDARMIKRGFIRISGTNGWRHESGVELEDDMAPAPIIGGHPVWMLYELGQTTPPPF